MYHIYFWNERFAFYEHFADADSVVRRDALISHLTGKGLDAEYIAH